MTKSCQISLRAKATPPSPIRKLAHYATARKAAGIHIHHLNIGQPDIKTPDIFWQALEQTKRSTLAYEQSQGNQRLIEAWSKYMNQSIGVKTAPAQFMITMGASEALVMLFMVCCDPGDEVLTFDPTYANFIGFAALAGVRLVPVATHIETGYVLPPKEQIIERITSWTKAILLCSPNNPTGSVYSAEDLQMLLHLCDERGLFLIVDETYREFVYDGRAPQSILQIVANHPQVIVVDSLSKRFSLCGARLGCLISSHSDLQQACLAVAQARLAAPSLEQSAAALLLEGISLDYVPEICGEYEKRRNSLCNGLAQIPGVRCHLPAGAFYVMAQLPVDCSENFAKFMLETFEHDRETVFVAPAAGFYMLPDRGQNEVRLACVLESNKLARAADLIAKGLISYEKSRRHS